MFRPKKGREEETPTPDEPEVLEPADAFLGTLRSEFDEPEMVPPGFQHLLDNVQQLIAAYHEGLLDKRGLGERLAKQRASDALGGEWTIGATTLSWYRRQGGMGAWMKVPPPSMTIGAPVPGTWQGTLDIPTQEELEAAHQAEADDGGTADQSGLGVLDLEGPSLPQRTSEERPLETPAVAEAAREEALSYQDTFEAGLQELLSKGVEEKERSDSAGDLPPHPRVTGAVPAPAEDYLYESPGPAARAGSTWGEPSGYDDIFGEDESPGSPSETTDRAWKSPVEEYLPGPSAETSSRGPVPAERAYQGEAPEEAAEPAPVEAVQPEAVQEDAQEDSDSSSDSGGEEEFFLPPEFFWDDEH